MRYFLATAAMVMLFGGAAAAQDAATPAPGDCVVPAGTQLDIEIAAPVGSKRAKPGDRFPIRLAHPLVLAGTTLIPAGAVGEGEVVHASPVKFGTGKPGELILAARFLDVGGRRVPLRGFRISAAGGVTTTFVTSGTGMIMAQNAGNIEVPAGSGAIARVARDTSLPCPSGPAR